MFCSGCGKKIVPSGDNKCPYCGTVNEPLRSFKKLDIDIPAPERPEIKKETPEPRPAAVRASAESTFTAYDTRTRAIENKKSARSFSVLRIINLLLLLACVVLAVIILLQVRGIRSDDGGTAVTQDSGIVSQESDEHGTDAQSDVMPISDTLYVSGSVENVYGSDKIIFNEPLAVSFGPEYSAEDINEAYFWSEEPISTQDEITRSPGRILKLGDNSYLFIYQGNTQPYAADERTEEALSSDDEEPTEEPRSNEDEEPTERTRSYENGVD